MAAIKPMHTRWHFVAVCVFLNYSCSAALYASEIAGNEFGRSITLQQEEYARNGIFVCKPVALDEKIFELITANNITSFQKYEQWLGRYIRYSPDEGGDIVAFADETLERKFGDCEDFAVFNAEVVRLLGYQPEVVALCSWRGNHAICAFRYHDRYAWFDNARLMQTQARSLEEFARCLFQEYDCSFILQLNVATLRWNLLFKRSEFVL